ncbi:MAG: F0F1 ATP synthase subunit B [Acidobacteria bacterium]|nr:F0F1 ATP synthase subunit B [Acidobacteriota bacterium]
MDNPLVQPDPGLFIWTILTFLVLVGLLAKFAWRPLLEALERRQATIAKALDDAKLARQELERLQKESAEMMRQARVEAEAIIARSRSDADALREELKQRARAESATIVKNAEQQIQLEAARAIQQIRHEAIDLSVTIASKILQRQVSREDNEALIEATLKQVEARHI